MESCHPPPPTQGTHNAGLIAGTVIIPLLAMILVILIVVGLLVGKAQRYRNSIIVLRGSVMRYRKTSPNSLSTAGSDVRSDVDLTKSMESPQDEAYVTSTGLTKFTESEQDMVHGINRISTVKEQNVAYGINRISTCLLYTSPSPRDATLSRMPSSA